MGLDHHHNFTRDRLIALLRESGFEVLDFTVPDPRDARMELYAVRQSIQGG
jgi:protein O-GlcNAc transferase